MGCGWSSALESALSQDETPQKPQTHHQQQQPTKPGSPVTATVYGNVSPIYKTLPQVRAVFRKRF